jgi:hypothetical protein
MTKILSFLSLIILFLITVIMACTLIGLFLVSDEEWLDLFKQLINKL